MLHRIPLWLSEFSMFREIPKYSRLEASLLGVLKVWYLTILSAHLWMDSGSNNTFSSSEITHANSTLVFINFETLDNLSINCTVQSSDILLLIRVFSPLKCLMIVQPANVGNVRSWIAAQFLRNHIKVNIVCTVNVSQIDIQQFPSSLGWQRHQ